MSTQQQTVLRVQTNKPSSIEISGATSLSVNEVSLSGITYSGTGTSDDPYVGGFGLYQSYIEFKVQGTGILYYNISLYDISFSGVSLYVSVNILATSSLNRYSIHIHHQIYLISKLMMVI